MAARRSASPIIKSQTRPSDKNTLRNSTKDNHRAQTAPTRSLEQNRRSSKFIPGAIPWRTAGIWRPPSFDLYLPPEQQEQPKPPEVKPWHSGRYVPKRSRSRSPRPNPYIEPSKPPTQREQPKIPKVKPWHSGRYIPKRSQSPRPNPYIEPTKPPPEPIWQPGGKPTYKTVPHYDVQNLRRTINNQHYSSHVNITVKTSMSVCT